MAVLIEVNRQAINELKSTHSDVVTYRDELENTLVELQIADIEFLRSDQEHMRMFKKVHQHINALLKAELARLEKETKR
jgi:hypothetical protein